MPHHTNYPFFRRGHTIPHSVVYYSSLPPPTALPVPGTTQMMLLFPCLAFVAVAAAVLAVVAALKILNMVSRYVFVRTFFLISINTYLLSALVAPPPSATALQMPHDKTSGWERGDSGSDTSPRETSIITMNICCVRSMVSCYILMFNFFHALLTIFLRFCSR